MTTRPYFGIPAMARRLRRAQLRIRVLAGVVVVTLIALLVFDIAAVAAMRRYLVNQTDTTLQTVLAATRPRLPVLLRANGFHPFPSNRTAYPSSGGAQAYSILGEYDIDYVPAHGRWVTLEMGTGPGLAVLPAGELGVPAARFSPFTMVSPGGKIQLRVRTVLAPGGYLVAGADLDQVNRTIGQFDLVVTLGSIAVVLLIGVGVFVVLRRGLHPIEAMAGQADRITVGDLTDRVSPDDPDSEVGRLGAALNGMLARIETAVGERETDQELMRQFFADASHELRTPLASLRANAELYQQGALTGRSDLDEVMRRIALETQRMGRLVDDMLRLARLDQHPEREHDLVNLSALIGTCVERAGIAEPARTWRTRVDADLLTMGDEEFLGHALDNLIANVHAHTPSGTVGTITAADRGGSVVIEVSDNGPGVPEDKLPRIFDRFYRAGTRSARPGAGLGLAIVAEIATAHGGAVEAAPNRPSGLRIILTLPAADSQPGIGVTSGIPVVAAAEV
jgi:two-component system, OmpR family, sensor kinase